MKLDTYIKSKGETEVAIAQRARCSQSAVNKVRRGAGNPSLGLLRRIYEATDGAVTPNDFLSNEEKRRGQ